MESIGSREIQTGDAISLLQTGKYYFANIESFKDDQLLRIDKIYSCKSGTTPMCSLRIFSRDLTLTNLNKEYFIHQDEVYCVMKKLHRKVVDIEKLVFNSNYVKKNMPAECGNSDYSVPILLLTELSFYRFRSMKLAKSLGRNHRFEKIMSGSNNKQYFDIGNNLYIENEKQKSPKRKDTRSKVSVRDGLTNPYVGFCSKRVAVTFAPQSFTIVNVGKVKKELQTAVVKINNVEKCVGKNIETSCESESPSDNHRTQSPREIETYKMIETRWKNKQEFLEEYQSFAQCRGRNITKNAVLNDTSKMCFYRMFLDVIKMGGYYAVGKRNEWRNVTSNIRRNYNLVTSVKSIRMQYNRLLLDFENHITSLIRKHETKDSEMDVDENSEATLMPSKDIKILNEPKENGGDELNSPPNKIVSCMLPRKVPVIDFSMESILGILNGNLPSHGVSKQKPQMIDPLKHHSRNIYVSLPLQNENSVGNHFYSVPKVSDLYSEPSSANPTWSGPRSNPSIYKNHRNMHHISNHQMMNLNINVSMPSMYYHSMNQLQQINDLSFLGEPNTTNHFRRNPHPYLY